MLPIKGSKMTDLRPQAQLKLRNCSIDIMCSNPNCCASILNRQLDFDVIDTVDGRRELTSQRCQNCGMITKVYIKMDAEVVGDVPKYVPKGKKKGNPKCDMTDCELYEQTPGNAVASWNVDCQECKESQYWFTYGKDNYKKKSYNKDMKNI